MNICVFSSSSNAIPEIYFDEAKKLGKLMGKKGHVMVNGGANVGLMQSITVAVSETGTNTIGIMPEKLVERSLVSDELHEVIVTKDMMERKAKMRELSDAFIALPGGFGTLEEILEVMTLRQLSYHTKPVVLINTNGFYDNLIRQFEVSYKEMFAKDIYRDLYFIANNSEEAIKYIEDYKPVELDSKWFKVLEK